MYQFKVNIETQDEGTIEQIIERQDVDHDEIVASVQKQLQPTDKLISIKPVLKLV